VYRETLLSLDILVGVGHRLFMTNLICNMKTIVGLLLLLLQLASCAPKQRSANTEAQSPAKYRAAGDPIREEILKELTDYYDHMSARNWDAYASHFWPGATITTVWQSAGDPAPRVLITTIKDFIAQAPQQTDL
jgi:hypothetical protein